MFVNLNPRWVINIFAVRPENGILVPRARLGHGDRHSEVAQASQTWVLCASLPGATGLYTNANRLTEWDGLQSESSGVRDESVTLVLRPSESSLPDSRTASVFWTPLSSLSFSQRVRTASAQKRSSGPPRDVVSPHLSLQVLEG